LVEQLSHAFDWRDTDDEHYSEQGIVVRCFTSA